LGPARLRSGHRASRTGDRTKTVAVECADQGHLQLGGEPIELIAVRLDSGVPSESRCVLGDAGAVAFHLPLGFVLGLGPQDGNAVVQLVLSRKAAVPRRPPASAVLTVLLPNLPVEALA
jgi:hypothetical protein